MHRVLHPFLKPYFGQTLCLGRGNEKWIFEILTLHCRALKQGSLMTKVIALQKVHSTDKSGSEWPGGPAGTDQCAPTQNRDIAPLLFLNCAMPSKLKLFC